MMDLSRANLLARKTEDHFMPGCFGGKQLVKNNCVKFVPTAWFLIHLTQPHTNPNLLLTMETGSHKCILYSTIRLI